MEKQKICIIGGGLTGLVTAISLSKFDFEIDLITDKLIKNFKSTRTIAISEENFNYLNKLNISKSLKKEIWVILFNILIISSFLSSCMSLHPS